MRKSLQISFSACLTLSIIFVTSAAFAVENEIPLPNIITLSGGPVWTSGGNTQTLNLANEITKTYTANQSTHTSGNIGIFVGVQRPLPYSLLGQIGVALTKVSSAKLSGEIWDDADPEFNNFNYRYWVSHNEIALKGKLLANCGWPVMPWISASLGIGFNRAHGFSNTPKIFEAIENPNFSSRTTTTFTYAIGVGIQHKMIRNWLIGVGYEFADWGKHQLGTAAGQTTNNVITVNHFYTNSILINLTYDADAC